MSVYIVYYVIITILAVLLTKYIFCLSNNIGYPVRRGRADKQKVLFVSITALLLILIIGLRSGKNGLDLYNSLGTGYFYYYEKINEDSVWEILRNFGKRKYANFEIGFTLFCKFLGTICDNQQILLLGCAVLSIAPVAYFICRNSKNTWLSIVIYLAMPFFGPANFSAIRQGIAIGLVMLSYEYIKERKPIFFLLTVLLACTFHSTAIVAIVAYPVYHFRLDRRSALYGGVGVLLLVFLLKAPLFFALARLLAENPEVVRSRAINLFLLLTVLYAFCVLFCRTEDDEIRGFSNIFWLACAAQAFAGINNVAGRVTWYFMPTLIILIPNLIVNMNIKEKQTLKYLAGMIGILACIVGLYFLRTGMVALAYPYEPFWIQR